jgi:hypothetical protein
MRVANNTTKKENPTKNIKSPHKACVVNCFCVQAWVLHLGQSANLARGKSCSGGNTTLVVGISAHPDVSTHAPVSAPRVLHNPVISA